MSTPELTGYPGGDAGDWKKRYRAFVDERRGEPVAEATVTAVVVTWAGSQGVEDCLRSLRRAQNALDQQAEIIVVDNGAGPQLAEATKHNWDRWIRFRSNLGPGPARNLGAAEAAGEFVAFVDDDGLVEPDYFVSALSYFNDPNLVALRGRVVAQDHPWFTLLATHYDRGPEPVEDALVTEGASVIRRRALIDAGGFPDAVIGHEGIELTYRLTRDVDRAKTLYVPDVVLRHDFLQSWNGFVAKCLSYAENEAAVQTRSPDIAQYMSDYFSRSYPSRPLGPGSGLIRIALQAMRSLLQTGGHLYYRIQHRSAKPPTSEP